MSGWAKTVCLIVCWYHSMNDPARGYGYALSFSKRGNALSKAEACPQLVPSGARENSNPPTAAEDEIADQKAWNQ